jgi:hypothetical protein
LENATGNRLAPFSFIWQKNMRPFIKCIFLCAMILFSGCTFKKQVRVDIDKFIQDQASYINENVVITGTLEDIVSRYHLYLGKRIEVSAPFTYYGSKEFWTWDIRLQNGENKLRCYTHYYRIKPANEATNLLLRAKNKKEPITVLGVLYRDGLDIDEFSYDGFKVRPYISEGRYKYYLRW